MQGIEDRGVAFSDDGQPRVRYKAKPPAKETAAKKSGTRRVLRAHGVALHRRLRQHAPARRAGPPRITRAAFGNPGQRGEDRHFGPTNSKTQTVQLVLKRDDERGRAPWSPLGASARASTLRAILCAGRMGDDDVFVLGIHLHEEMAANEGGELFGISPFGRYIPHSRRLFRTCGDDAATIGAIRGAVDAVLMSLELSDQAPAVGLPHPRRMVSARGDDAATIGAIRGASDGRPMPNEHGSGGSRYM